jgi:hypothetical protein
LAVILVGAVGVAAAIWLYDRYNFSVLWPSKVQQQTLGTTIATADTLLTSERHFAYGEGFARWRYKLEGSNPALRQLCGKVDVGNCAFSRSRTVEDGVDLSVSLSAGVLTVEEWWR